MTSNSDAGILTSRDHSATALLIRVLPWLALAALFAVAVVLRHLVAANTDVSWLLTAGERVLSGQRLYVDVIETNPPMAVFAYLPGIMVARALGVAAETAVDALVFAGIFASLLLSARVLRRTSVLERGQGWPVALVAFAILAILPTQTFGQREHIAVIALLPMLAVMATRTKGVAPTLPDVIMAGLGAAVALSFKPHFVIAVCCGLAVLAAVNRPSWRTLLLPECLVIAAAMAFYVAVVITLFPEFFTTIGPLVRDVYLPVKLPLPVLLVKPALWLSAIAMFGTVLLRRRSGLGGPLALLLAISFGFAIVFVLQQKGWPYHSYPMLALSLLGLGYAVISHRPASPLDRAFGVGAVIVLAALFMRSMLWFDLAFDARPLQQAVARLGPHPAILAISGEPGIGHPLVRAVGGIWVSRQQALWVATYLDAMRKRGLYDPALETYAARERAMLIDDIHLMPPTVVMVDDLTGNGSAWLNAHPDVAGLLKDFRPVETINKVTILVRRD